MTVLNGCAPGFILRIVTAVHHFLETMILFNTDYNGDISLTLVDTVVTQLIEAAVLLSLHVFGLFSSGSFNCSKDSNIYRLHF